ncbi:MAG: hypothetical protein AAGJ46_02080 [Planctomycetota bacterium]
MRGLLALGALSALITPVVIWQLAERLQADGHTVEVVGGDLVVTSAEAEVVLPVTRKALSAFCQQQSVIVPGDYKTDIEQTVKRWRRVDEMMQPQEEVAQRFTLAGSDARGVQWRVEAICGGAAPTLIFVHGDCLAGPSRLTIHLAEALRRATDYSTKSSTL